MTTSGLRTQPTIPMKRVSPPARIASSDTNTKPTASASPPARPTSWEVTSSPPLPASAARSNPVRAPARNWLTSWA